MKKIAVLVNTDVLHVLPSQMIVFLVEDYSETVQLFQTVIVYKVISIMVDQIVCNAVTDVDHAQTNQLVLLVEELLVWRQEFLIVIVW